MGTSRLDRSPQIRGSPLMWSWFLWIDSIRKFVVFIWCFQFCAMKWTSESFPVKWLEKFCQLNFFCLLLRYTTVCLCWMLISEVPSFLAFDSVMCLLIDVMIILFPGKLFWCLKFLKALILVKGVFCFFGGYETQRMYPRRYVHRYIRHDQMQMHMRFCFPF